MARDRLDHLKARYAAGLALAELAEAVRDFLSARAFIDKDNKQVTKSLEAYNALSDAFDDLWNAAYVELPDE